MILICNLNGCTILAVNGDNLGCSLVFSAARLYSYNFAFYSKSRGHIKTVAIYF